MFDGFHHVQLAMPRGEEEAARAFFVGLLGLTEIDKPPVLAARGGAWFRAGGLELHLGVEDDSRPARKGHPGILSRSRCPRRAAARCRPGRLLGRRFPGSAGPMHIRQPAGIPAPAYARVAVTPRPRAVPFRPGTSASSVFGDSCGVRAAQRPGTVRPHP